MNYYLREKKMDKGTFPVLEEWKMKMSKVFRGWHPVAGALAVCTLAFAVSVQGAPRGDNSRGLDKVRSDTSRLVTSGGDAVNQLLDGGVAGVIIAIDITPIAPANGSLYPSSVSISSSTITSPGNHRAWFDILVSGFAPLELKGVQVNVDFASYSSGAGAPLENPTDACAGGAECAASLGLGSRCAGADPPNFCGAGCCRPGFYNGAKSNWIAGVNAEFPLLEGDPSDFGIANVATASTEFSFGVAILDEPCKKDAGDDYYAGTWVIDIPLGAVGTYTIGFLPTPSSFITACDNSLPAFVVNGGVIDVPDGQCCGGLDCLSDNGSESQCTDAGGTNFTAGKTCAEPCSCLGNNANCNDGDRCTDDICNAADICENPDNFPDTDCCEPATGDLSIIDDGDGCTTDSCSASNNRGSAEHPVSSAGTGCDDGNDCFFGDVCDGANSQAGGGCSGTDVNLETCTTSADCETKTGVAFDCVGGFCFCTLSPDLGFIVDGDKCLVDDQKVNVAVHVGAASVPINGAQFVIEYDPTCLSFNSIAPAGGAYTQQVAEIVNTGAGTIFYAVGVDFGTVGDFGNADLAVVSFTKIGGCASCQLCFGGENPMNTFLTDDDGQFVGVTPSCSNTISGAGSLSINVPPSVKVNSDCTSPTSLVTWDAPSSGDTCGGTTIVCEGLHRSGLEYTAAEVANGGEIPQGDSGFTCCAINECGAEACDGWTVTVNDSNSLDVVIQMSPTMRTAPGATLTRCIKFEVFNNCLNAPLVFEQDIHFGGLFDFVGKFTDQIKIPDAIQPACITARDQHHSLRSCYLFGAGDCVDGVLSARFSGDPLLGGNWLTGGNLDGYLKEDPNASHDVIDILDFGQFVAQYNETYDSDGDGNPDGNTPCGAFSGGHADINGDGIVDILDFSFVSMNFLEDSKDCCCPAGAAKNAPRTSVTVRELRQMGMLNLISADLNSDGVVDLNDMAAFLNGDIPVKKVRGTRSLGR